MLETKQNEDTEFASWVGIDWADQKRRAGAETWGAGTAGLGKEARPSLRAFL
jgi:hypothetical protein